jgi:SAM-dependent methyltransferase
MAEEMWKLDWANVDKTPDPTWFLRFLDESRKFMPPPSHDAAKAMFGFLDVREGHRVLDVGCGTGLHSHMLALLVGQNGLVTGVDYSEEMVREARKRAESLGLKLEYRQGDANKLEFEDGTFDRVWASSLLQHLEDPARAVKEMVRVLTPTGLVCSFEHDWETFLMDADDKSTARIISNLFSDSIRVGGMGRQVPRLFRNAGLSDVTVTGVPMIMTNLNLLEDTVLNPIGRHAVNKGIIEESSLASLKSDLRRKAEAGNPIWSFMVFRVTGKRQ